jgi:hypothetical protein
VIDSSGATLWHVHRELAQELVARGMACDEKSGGRVRKIRLTRPAIHCAHRIGPPSAPTYGVSFTYYERLDGCGARIIQHSRRCLDP